MYEHFYKLSNDPFRLLPDPGVCYSHRSSGRAWAYLRYALKRGEGIVVVTGAPGSGKTTLAERLLGELNPAKIISVRLVANDLSTTDLLRKLAYALGLPVEGKDRAMLALLIERHLVAVEHSQRRVLVVIDEAQMLSHQSLEAMRLLTDMQSQTHPTLQLVLFGQEDLEGVMSAPGMEQFQQRVIASCRLQPMNLKETKAYLEYRLGAAGWFGDPSINGPAVMAIYRYSHGVPRHVNKICSRLLLHGSSEEKHSLNEGDVKTVVRDLRSELLAPLTEEPESVHDTAPGVFNSVYELALVPSAAPGSRDAVGSGNRNGAFPQRGYGSQVSVADDADAGQQLRNPGRGHVHSRRYMMRVGRRPGRSMPRAIWRRLVRQHEWLTRLAAVSLREGGTLLQRSRTWFAKVGAGMREGSAVALQRVRERWPQIIAMLGRPLGGVPAGLLIVAGTAVLLAAIITVWPADVEQLADTRPHQAEEPAAEHAQALIGDSILDDVTRYVTPLIDKDDPADRGDNEIGTLLAHNFPASSVVSASPVQVSPRPGVQPHAAGATGLGRYHEISLFSAQPLLGKVSGDAATDMLHEAERFETSLNVWALARRPDAVSVEGVNVWSLDRESGEASLRGVIMRVPDEQLSAEEDVAAPELATAVVDESQAGTTGRPPSVGVMDSEGIDAGIDDAVVVVADEPRDALEYVRYLPATSAGGVEPVVDTASALEIIVAEEPEPVRAGPAETAAPLIGFGERTVVPSNERLAMLDVDSVVKPVAPASRVDEPAAGQQTAEARVSAEREKQVRAEADIAADRERRVTQLVRLGNKALAVDRLLIPEKRSAFTLFRQVLAIDADNAAAKKGIKRIVGRYAELANEALVDESFDKADLYVARGLRIMPDSARMRAIRGEVSKARAEAEAVMLAEAEMARLAADVEEPPPLTPAPKPKPSSFKSLMKLVEGL